MPSFDKNKRLKLPSIAAKLAGIRGLGRIEKAQLVRVGNLIDALVVSRNISNTRETGSKKIDPNKVPSPSGITVTAIVGGLEIKWTAINFNKLDYYEVQISSSSNFSNPTTFNSFTNRIIIKGITGEIFVRVRTISREGYTSTYSSPASGGTTVSVNLFDIDTDKEIFEIVTRGVGPDPELLGKNLAPESTGGKAFVTVGACVGPGPISFTDSAGGVVKNQITYQLREYSSSFYLPSQSNNLGIPTTGDSSGFYDASSRTYTVFPGSFIDFFYIEPLQVNPAHINVLFLQYQKGTEQTGVVKRASDSVIEF